MAIQRNVFQIENEWLMGTTTIPSLYCNRQYYKTTNAIQVIVYQMMKMNMNQSETDLDSNLKNIFRT